MAAHFIQPDKQLGRRCTRLSCLFHVLPTTVVDVAYTSIPQQLLQQCALFGPVHEIHEQHAAV